MLGAANVNAFHSGAWAMQGYLSGQIINPDDLSEDYAKRVRQQIENRLLNTQARIEYELLKGRILNGTAQANKFFNQDDQITVQEYKLCLSLSYRRRIFVMEFRQVQSDNDQCNHSLELIFRATDFEFNNGCRSTLVLNRDHNQFIWQQLHPIAGGPGGSTRILSGLIIRWLQAEESLRLRLASA